MSQTEIGGKEKNHYKPDQMNRVDNLTIQILIRKFWPR